MKKKVSTGGANSTRNYFDDILISRFSFSESKNPDQTLLENLKYLDEKVSALKPKDNPAPLLHVLTDLIEAYFDHKADNSQDTIHKEIAETYGWASFRLLEKAYKSDIETYLNHMAIGSIVETLVYCGLKKMEACRAIAKWIKIEIKSTGRKKPYTVRQIQQFNQLYRERHNPHDEGDFFAFSPYAREILFTIFGNPDFPFDLCPSAPDAFDKMLELMGYKLDYVEEQWEWVREKEKGLQEA